MNTDYVVRQLDQVEPDPRNPRKIFDETALIELGTNISVNGLAQPLVVRPHPDPEKRAAGIVMLVCGERRWRAMQMADIAEAETVLRELDDRQAFDLQVAENGPRVDVHPLEEADIYRRYREEHGVDVEEIADITGKTKAYIYAQLKLCALADGPRQEFLAGKLDKSRALLIARLPESRQAEACKAILTEGDYDEGGVMSFRDAKEHIRYEYMLKLADAPFDPKDAKLVAEAGSCTECEKRTGNQREVFEDVVADKDRGGADVCTDSTCYKAKVDVHWSRLKASAEAKGCKVIEGAERGRYGDQEYVDLDAGVYDLGIAGGKSARELLGDKRADRAIVAVSRDDRGEIRELISRSDLPALLKDAGIKVPQRSEREGGTGDGKSAADYQREAKEARELEQAVTLAARDAALAKLDDLGALSLWHLLARLAIRCSGADAQKELMALHEVPHEGKYSSGQRAELIEYTNGLPLRALRDFTVELLMAEAGGWRADTEGDGEGDGEAETMSVEELAEIKAERLDYMTGVEHAAQLFSIDMPAIVVKVKGDLEVARKAKDEKRSKPKKDKKKTPASPAPDDADGDGADREVET